MVHPPEPDNGIHFFMPFSSVANLPKLAYLLDFLSLQFRLFYLKTNINLIYVQNFIHCEK